MSPMIVIVLILIGLIGAYFLMGELTTAQMATSGPTSSAVANYSTLAIKILMVVMALYAIYYIVDVIKTSARERRALDRKNKMLEAREKGYSK